VTIDNQPARDIDGFSARVRDNQARLAAALKPRYDFVVCGAGSTGSVIARRLAENPDVSVLLVEAGGDDESPAVTEAGPFARHPTPESTGDRFRCPWASHWAVVRRSTR
jgi:choline dehydrogenase-like flavoprotein